MRLQSFTYTGGLGLHSMRAASVLPKTTYCRRRVSPTPCCSGRTLLTAFLIVLLLLVAFLGWRVWALVLALSLHA
jgi:hypothetical protein